jgi:hypothetical protein
VARTVDDRVRAICLSFPEVIEKLSHGARGYFVKKQFVMLWATGHDDHQFPHLWCAAPAGVQDELVDAEPERFFRPPYVGVRGWLGVRLDGRVDWDEIAAVCEDAYRNEAAPTHLSHSPGVNGGSLRAVKEQCVRRPPREGDRVAWRQTEPSSRRWRGFNAVSRSVAVAGICRRGSSTSTTGARC